MENKIEIVVLNIHQKMALIKAELAEIEMTRSGENTHQHFKYLELKDFMPHVLKLNAKYGINSVFNRDMEKAKLVLYDTESDQKIKFKMPYDYNGIGMLKGIQKDGGADTYSRRYMYIRAYDLADNDIIDSADNSKVIEVPRAKVNQAELNKYLELYKIELAKAMNKAEASAVYRKYEGKINNDDAAKLGAARMNEIKIMELAKEVIKNKEPDIAEPAKDTTKNVLSDAVEAKTTASSVKVTEAKTTIETKLDTKLIDLDKKENETK